MKFSQFACAVAVALFASASAHATMVTYEFAGAIDSSGIDGYGVNTPVTGQISLDTDTEPTDAPISVGEGLQFVTFAIDQPGSFTMNVGSDTFTTSQVLVTLLDNTSGAPGQEGIGFLANALYINGEPTGSAIAQVSLQTPGDKDVLTANVPANISLADFQDELSPPSGYFATSTDSDALSFSFAVTSFKKLPGVGEVPEVSTMVSMSAGMLLMAGLVAAQRRKARQN
jgi:hypothetical protein